MTSRYGHARGIRAGLLRNRARLTMQVIATAGHAGHGKSALVRALTGMDPRRPERIAASLDEAEAVAVSAVTGEGLPDLAAALARLAGSLPVPDTGAPVRIWVDGTYTGTGTVVTGTLPLGTVRRGDELVISPSMRPVRVRDIRSLGEPAAELAGPARAACSLGCASHEHLGQGMALVHPGAGR